MNASETIDYLVGSWRVRRSILDHLEGERGAFEGVATFTRNDSPKSSLHFEESGEVRLGSFCGQARRELIYVGGHDAVTVTFHDGRHFFDLDLTHGTSRGVHLCNVDRYEITTIARSFDRFEEHWRVTGPRKDYDATTVLERLT